MLNFRFKNNPRPPNKEDKKDKVAKAILADLVSKGRIANLTLDKEPPYDHYTQVDANRFNLQHLSNGVTR